METPNTTPGDQSPILNMSDHPQYIAVSGNTYPHRDELRTRGGRWNRGKMQWEFNKRHVTDMEPVVCYVNDVNGVTADDEMDAEESNYIHGSGTDADGMHNPDQQPPVDSERDPEEVAYEQELEAEKTALDAPETAPVYGTTGSDTGVKADGNGITADGIELPTEWDDLGIVAFRPEVPDGIDATQKLEVDLGHDASIWGNYGFTENRLYFNEKPSRSKVIRQQGKEVAVVGNDYSLLPNEVALSIADKTTEKLGLSPMNLPGKDTHVKYGGPGGRRMFAFYKFDDVTVDSYRSQPGQPDFVQLGVMLTNAEDGSGSFAVGGFTLAALCENMVTMAGNAIIAPTKARKGIWGGFETLGNSYSRRHTSNFLPTLDGLSLTIEAVVRGVRYIAMGYQKMAAELVTQDIVDGLLASTLPASSLPEWMRAPKVKKGETADADWKPTVPEGMTQWEVYNDCTANIWHGRLLADGKTRKPTDIGTRVDKVGELHKCFEVLAIPAE